MVLAWVLYALLVTVALGWAAMAAERILRLYDRQARGAWAVAMLASCVGPLLLLLVPGLLGGDSTPGSPPGWAVPAVPAIMGTVQGAAESGGPVLRCVQWIFFGPWGLISVGLVAWLARSAWAIQRREDSWAPLASDGDDLYRSDELGPAAVGVRRPRVVLPDWVMELDDPDREMVVLHEREHARARDPALVALGWAMVVIAPWNLPLWWHFRRLRQAVELDCDLRVVRRIEDRQSYGRVLLEAYRMMSGHPVAPMATGGESFVGDRIRTLVDRKPPFRALRAVSGATAIVCAALLVATLPSPRAAQAWAGQVELDRIWTGFTTGRSPTGTRNDAAIANRADVMQAIEAHYPDHLRREGIDGVVHVLAKVRPDGSVGQVLVQASSGHPALDEAARDVASQIRFDVPDTTGDSEAFWMIQPIRFRAE